MRMPATMLLLVAAAAATAQDGRMPQDQRAREGWRRLATPVDRSRLRGWRDAWVAGLAQAQGTAEGAAAIAADPVLFDPDGALLDPLPPPGDYRCRTIKLGRQGPAPAATARTTGGGYVAYGWSRCRVGAGPAPVTLVRTGGSQRPIGTIHADTDARMVFLGTLALGDEARPIAYGRDRSRDMAGMVERIGPGRWRLALPRPAFESTLDLMELVPAG